MHYSDLTHTITPSIPVWNSTDKIAVDVVLDYHQCSVDTPFCVQRISLPAGVGTHIDAPAHCIKGGKTVDQICLENCIVPLVLIDLSAYMNEKYIVDGNVIKNFEAQYGTIEPKSCVIFLTGWGMLWNDSVRYHNTYQFPSLSVEVAHLLVERKISGVGIDTLSVDGPDNTYKVHQILLGADVYILENVAYAKDVPAKGATLFVFPLKMQGLTEAPVRLLVQKK